MDSGWNVGDWYSIAVDTSDHAHISYHDFTNGHLKYATNASGSWATATIDSEEDVGWSTSLALDASGSIHISYGSGGDNIAIKYATNVSGSWVITTVNSNEDLFGYTSLALDATGHAHIGYFDYANGELKYATNVSGSWITTVADKWKGAGGYTSWRWTPPAIPISAIRGIVIPIATSCTPPMHPGRG